jgi:Tfp pilus assembly protein PilF
MNLLGKHREAIEYYSRAVREGLKNEVVFNNLGFSHLRRNNLPTARELFSDALRINPQLRAALQNRALLEWKWAIARRTSPGPSAAADIESAINLAPGHGNLHYVAACIWCLSNAPNRIDRALDHAERAITLGLKPEKLEQGTVFGSLLKEPRMTRLLQRQPRQLLAADPPAIVNPDTP